MSPDLGERAACRHRVDVLEEWRVTNQSTHMVTRFYGPLARRIPVEISLPCLARIIAKPQPLENESAIKKWNDMFSVGSDRAIARCQRIGQQLRHVVASRGLELCNRQIVPDIGVVFGLGGASEARQRLARLASQKLADSSSV